MLIAKASPGSAPGDLHWEKAGDVVEVSDPHLAAELLRRPEFSEVAPEAGAAPKKDAQAKRTAIAE